MKVRDLLRLDDFRSFRLIAGDKGIDNFVIRGGIIDYETPSLLKSQEIESEFLFSNLPMIKDQPDKILDYVLALIDKRVACFAIKTSLFKEIPAEVIDAANNNDFPLFMFDDLYLDKLVLSIDQSINKERQLKDSIKIFESIRKNSNYPDLVKLEVDKLHRHFLKSYRIYKLKKKADDLRDISVDFMSKMLGESSFVLPIKNDVLIVFTSDDVHIDVKALKYRIGEELDNFYIGVSRQTSDFGFMGQLIYETEIALKYLQVAKKNIVSYEDIGIYQILIPSLELPVQSMYYEEIIRSIEDYDSIHQSDLLGTAKAYVKADGNIKETASMLFQHENTIRFRIRKLKEVTHFDENEGVKYETLALAIHLNEIKSKIN